MAHSKSAIKRHRQSLRRRERNRSRRTEVRSAVRKARELIAVGDKKDEAEAAVREATTILDRVARKGTLHPNNAARRKSRLVRALNAAQAAPKKAAPRRRRTRAKAPDEGDSEES